MTRRQTSSHRFHSHKAFRSLAAAAVAIALLLLGTASAQAQRRSNAGRSSTAQSSSAASTYSPATSHVSFGAELAFPYLFSSFNGTSINGIGIHVGGVVDIPVTPKTGVLLKAGYESKHGSVSVSEGNASASISMTLNYFELAGLLRHDLSENISLHGGLALQFDAGGSSAQITAQSGSQHATGELGSGTLSMPTQIALVAGAGYRIPLTPTIDLVPNASFNLSLTSPTPNGNASVHTFTIGARVMFR
jgi:hypothetical protein